MLTLYQANLKCRDKVIQRSRPFFYEGHISSLVKISRRRHRHHIEVHASIVESDSLDREGDLQSKIWRLGGSFKSRYSLGHHLSLEIVPISWADLFPQRRILYSLIAILFVHSAVLVGPVMMKPAAKPKIVSVTLTRPLTPVTTKKAGRGASSRDALIRRRAMPQPSATDQLLKSWSAVKPLALPKSVEKVALAKPAWMEKNQLKENQLNNTHSSGHTTDSHHETHEAWSSLKPKLQDCLIGHQNLQSQKTLKTQLQLNRAGHIVGIKILTAASPDLESCLMSALQGTRFGRASANSHERLVEKTFNLY